MDVTKELSSIRLDPHSTVPLYLQIAKFIAEKIQGQFFPEGTKLPPERNLAKILAVSRTTAINAYRYLEEQEMVITKIGSGTYVSKLPFPQTPVTLPIPWEQLFVPHLKNPLSSILRDLVGGFSVSDSISLAAGMPDPSLYPVKIFEDLLNKNLPNLSPWDLGHIPIEGYQPLRHSLAKMQERNGILAKPDNILMLTGSQQGLYLITRTLIEPGDYVVIDSPTYIGAIQAFQGAGARILSLPPSNNLSLEMLEDYLIRYRPKFFYTSSTFQNPTGRVLSLKERQELLTLAAKHRLVIVEDDPYSHLYYDQQPPPSLKALDHYGGVLYLSTFSKILFPGLRTGWLVGAPSVVNRLAQEKQYIDMHSNNLTQWLLHLFLEQGVLDSHLFTVRLKYKKRRDAMISSIRRFCGNTLSFNVPQGGFYLWCQINSNFNSNSLLHEASKAGVTFVPGEAFYTNQWGSREIRLCFSAHEEAKLVHGIKRIAKILNQSSLIRKQEDLTFPINPPII